MTVSALTVSRQFVRSWLMERYAAFERAQASGSLARTRLDIRDAFEAELRADNQPEQEIGRALLLFDQEADAMMADARLATVTVRHEVERVAPQPSPIMAFTKAIFFTLGVFIVAITVFALMSKV